MSEIFILNWIATIPTFAAPLLLASLGLILSERSGVINLGAEGLMAAGAMSAALVSFHTGNPWLSIFMGSLSAMLLAVVFAIAVVIFRTDQVLSGLTVVALGAGLTGIIGRPYMHQPITGFEKLDLGYLSHIPWIGQIVFRQNPMVYVTILIVILIWWGLMRTNTGLRLRAVGEDPATADIAGVNVCANRFVAVLLSGVLCGLAGAYLSIASSQIWVEGMIAGRGWIAVALVIFARWRPLRAVLGALIFGGAEALIPRMQAIGADVPVYLVMMLPYAVTLFVLIAPAIFQRRISDEPESLGLEYLRQDPH
jgi:general nucleoside transport system permease protein